MRSSTSRLRAGRTVLRAPSLAALAILVVASLALPAFAQLAPGGGARLGAGLGGAGVSPLLLEQFRGLPVEEQRRLARQYGVDLETLSGEEALREVNPVGVPGEEIVPATRPSRFLGAGAFADDLLAPVRDQETVLAMDPSARFGLGLFTAQVSTFAPVDNAPVPGDYRLGPGDVIELQLSGKDNFQTSLLVGRDGSIFQAGLGNLVVAGLTLSEVQDTLRKQAAERLIGTDVRVTLGRLRAINVFLAGEVNVPGNRSLSALSRVSHALFSAGGLTEIGSLRDIVVRRHSEVVARFDVYDLLLRGDASGDVRLQDGDVVFVPPVRDMASVGGEVRRPSVYEIEAGTRVSDLIEMAGGLTARALAGEGVLETQVGGSLPRIDRVDLARPEDLERVVARGDHLRVLRNSMRFENRVVLEGAVQRPGVYGYREEMRVSDLLANPDSDLAEDVDYEYALVVSQSSLGGDISVQPFSVRRVLDDPAGDGDPLLAPRDRVLLFKSVAGEILDSEVEQEQTEAEVPAREPEEEDGDASDPERSAGERASRGGDTRDDRRVVDAADDYEDPTAALERVRASSRQRHAQREAQRETLTRQEMLAPIISRLEAQASPGEPVRIVSVSGAVHIPGDYPLSEGDTVRELLAAAGGASDDAFLLSAELRRVVTDVQSGRALLRNIDVNLAALDSADTTQALSSRDHLHVRRIPDWRPRDTVEIEGEVRFPGTYVIGPGDTLSDLLSRAGGLTEQGFAEGVVFTRASLREQEARETRRFISELRRNIAASTLTLEGVQAGDLAGIDDLAESLVESEGLGRLIVDVPRVLRGDEAADVTLQPGDRVRVPPRVRSVTVIGEVQRAGSYRFQERYDVDDYIATSAGLTRRADEGRMYVLRANGEIQLVEAERWFAFDLDDGAIRPGDTIVVPIDTSYRNTLEYWGSLTQIAYQSGIALAALLAI